MAQLHRKTKNERLIIEDLKLLGAGQNLKDTSKKTTPRFSVEFERENGTKMVFRLCKEEVSFLRKQINKNK